VIRIYSLRISNSKPIFVKQEKQAIYDARPVERSDTYPYGETDERFVPGAWDPFAGSYFIL
jgi:hypothetical protein